MSKSKIDIHIITCPQWGAVRPRQGIETVGMASREVLHHTAGHHREISNPNDESLEEAIRYARDIQHFHMVDNGWIDSGHNFLITRAGHILQGRWLTVSAIQSHHMVRSAHCPGQNDQIGVEHEHKGNEPMTAAQRKASATLSAWIADIYQKTRILPIHPHKEYINTACPANLISEIPKITTLAQQILRGDV